VSVWPFIAGDWADDRDHQQRTQAADLLARLHRAMAKIQVSPRPTHSALHLAQTGTHPEVVDPELDLWLTEFDKRYPRRHALHGDFYPGNVIARDNCLTGIVDWDDVFVGQPERELAWAGREWGDDLRRTLNPGSAMRFIDRYVTAAGTASRVSEEDLVQLVRDRIRMEVNYSYATGQWGRSTDPEEREYEELQLYGFRALRP
jgi:aminoglycoside phosphotransferase (APT) family kinase protein